MLLTWEEKGEPPAFGGHNPEAKERSAAEPTRCLRG